MANVTITRQWPDGDVLVVRVKLESSYPDAVREGVRAALDAYSEGLGLTLTPVEGDE